MMADLLFVQRPCDEVAAGLAEALTHRGLSVQRSFDLHSARAAHAHCSCPHHGTALCDCQLVVLLVYGQGDGPVTLLVHGRDGQTSVMLVETPTGDSPAEPLESALVNALTVLA